MRDLEWADRAYDLSPRRPPLPPIPTKACCSPAPRSFRKELILPMKGKYCLAAAERLVLVKSLVLTSPWVSAPVLAEVNATCPDIDFHHCWCPLASPLPLLSRTPHPAAWGSLLEAQASLVLTALPGHRPSGAFFVSCWCGQQRP